MDIPDLTPTLLPLQNSADANAVEAALKQQFLDLFMQNLRAGERELNVSGMPHLGTIDLIERHVKLDGLALIRTDEPSMKYLYRAWRARNPKRGMHFLRTYLQLLWPNGWVVNQMWQDKNSAYPTGLSARSAITDTDPHTTHYLTSRIRVLIDDDRESGFSIPSVVPALRSVVAAKFVLEIQLLKRFANTDDHGLGLANGATAQNMAYFEGGIETQEYSTGLEFGNGMYQQNFMYSGGDVIPWMDATPPSLTLDFAGTQTLDSSITFARSTAGWRFNSAGVLESIAANLPRFDYDPTTLVCKGLLIEEASTNYILNSSMQGAVAGSPGTLPNYWTGASGGGFASSIVAVGVESGIPYVDIRYYGTPTSTGTYQIANMGGVGNQGISLSSGTPFMSAFVRLSSGSLSGVGTVNLVARTFKTGTLVPNSDVVGPDFKAALVSGSLSGYRASYQPTMPINTRYVTPAIQFTVTSGVPIDFTVRIGLPQFEFNSISTNGVLTSPIPTTSATVSRSADDCSIASIGGWFNASTGTFVIAAKLPDAKSNLEQQVVSMSDSTGHEQLSLGKSLFSATVAKFLILHGGATQANLSSTPTSIADFKMAAAYAANDFACVSSGGAFVTGSSGALAAPTVLSIGKNAPESAYMNGCIGKIVYYPSRVTNAKLQSLIA